MNDPVTMDAVDKARFSRIEVEEGLQSAFRKVFTGDSVDTVLEYLTDFCGYGYVIQDPALLLMYAHRQQVLMEIKKMIGAEETFKAVAADEIEGDSDNEA